MADNHSFDCEATDLLLCNEETTNLRFDGGDNLFDSFNHQSYQTNGKNDVSFGNGKSDSDPFVLFPCLNEEIIGWMVERESEYLPRDDYLKRLRGGELDMSFRREALEWMIKACCHHNFGELCLYLAVNYFDRFLSVYDLPVGKIWVIQLVAVACLSLAAKIEEVHVPSTVDLQAGEPRFLFEGKTIQRMEILVLSYLKWKIKGYTPINFIDYFLRKMNGGELQSGPLITRSIQIILSTIKGIDFLEFKPSEIAAAVAMHVSGEIQTLDIDKALSSSIQVEKGKVVKCLELIQDLTSISGTISTTTIASANVGIASSSSSIPHSPNGVLDAAFFSYKSDERTVGSCPSSSHPSPDTKRRKLNQTTTIGGDS